MIVSKVHYCNIDKLYEVIYIGKHDKEYKRDLSTNMNKMLSHVSITFEITDISIFSVFILKMLSNDNNMVISSSTVSMNEIDDNYSKAIQDMNYLSEVISNDEDIEFKVNTFFLPTACVKKDVIVTFSGNSLCNIFGVLPDIFFYKTFGFNDDNEMTPYIPDYLKLENSIITEFANQFYKYMDKFVSNIDLLVDSYIHANYYNYIDDKKTNVNISEVFTPYGNISFFNNNSTDLNNQIIKCKDTFKLINDTRSYPFKNTEIYFTINCSFYAFLEMFLTLPTSMFIDHQDVKTLFIPSHTLLIPDGLTKYMVRLGSKITNLVKIQGEIASDKNNALKKYNFVPLNSSFKFTMKISLDDVSSIIRKYENSILKNNIYGEKSYLTLEIIHILEEIKNNSQKIFAILN